MSAKDLTPKHNVTTCEKLTRGTRKDLMSKLGPKIPRPPI